MKIMLKRDFDRMPAGTVFTEFHPCYYGGIMIKEDGGHENDCDFHWIKGYGWCWNGASNLIPDLDYIEKLWERNVEKTDGRFIGTENECRYYIGTTEETENTCWDCSSADYSDNDLFVVFEEYEVKRMIKMLQDTLTCCLMKGE